MKALNLCFFSDPVSYGKDVWLSLVWY